MQAPFCSRAFTSALAATGVSGSGRTGLAGVERGQIGHVLLGQRRRDAAHGGVLAVALLVGLERRHDVLVRLARDHRHLVDFGKAVLVALDAVAADAHGGLFLASLNITGDALGLGRHGSDKQRRSGDKGTDDRDSMWVILLAQ
jgi:hypothetical protein